MPPCGAGGPHPMAARSVAAIAQPFNFAPVNGEDRSGDRSLYRPRTRCSNDPARRLGTYPTGRAAAAESFGPPDRPS